MSLDVPPIQEKTTAPNGLFPQTWIRWFEDITACVNAITRGFDNTIIVKEASDLVNIDSTKNYMIDGAVDMGTTPIVVPEGGISLAGLNGARDTSILYSDEDNYTMFVSPDGGYSGGVVLESCTVDVTGAGSEVFNLDNNGFSSAIDIIGVNFGRSPVNRLTSLGELTDYRQLLVSGVGFVFCDDGLTLNGGWSGLAAVTSIAVGFLDGATLFKEGTSLTFDGSVRSDMNFLSTGSTSVFMDFDEADVVNDAALTLDGFRTSASNPLPNLPPSSVKARFSGCTGVGNTYVGGQYYISTSATTVIPASNTLTKIAGTTAYDDLYWFSSGGNNAISYDSSVGIEVLAQGVLSFTGSSNKTIAVQIRQWVASTSSYINVGQPFVGTIGAGGRAENLVFIAKASINQNDRIEVWVENRSDSSNITAEVGGTVIVGERAS